MPIYLKSLALRDYRGIGPEFQKLREFKDFNFFIGANNSGKFTFLNFISRYLPSFRTPVSYAHPVFSIDPLERHNAALDPVEMALGYSPDEFRDSTIRRANTKQWFQNTRMNLDGIIKGLTSDDGLIWIKGEIPYGEKRGYLDFDERKISTSLSKNEWKDFWSFLLNRSGGDVSNWIGETVEFMLQAQNAIVPKAEIIPAIRQIGAQGAEFKDYSGTGLIDRLAEIQSPDHDKRQDKELFIKINNFLRDVTDRPTTNIEVPHNRAHLLVHMDNKVLPLSSLGTGIQEVIMISAFCTIAENKIICIEEPELHLHPILQRKMISYLKLNTRNQYFIATHSASFIDTPDSAIFHVRLENNKTTVSEAILKRERYAICEDLGHKASDIIQSNAIIWVEGPSDRVYLKKWISTLNSSLIEGIHYSIMFYGGRLLSHLSADDEEVSEFIELHSLNRNLAILIDSDKSGPSQKVNSTKNRILTEFSKSNACAWITKGREIENYIEHSALHSAIKEIYKDKYKSPHQSGQYDHSLYFIRSGPGRGAKSSELVETNVDKMKVARLVCEKGSPNLKILDLEARLRGLISMIERANR